MPSSFVEMLMARSREQKLPPRNAEELMRSVTTGRAKGTAFLLVSLQRLEKELGVTGEVPAQPAPARQPAEGDFQLQGWERAAPL